MIKPKYFLPLIICSFLTKAHGQEEKPKVIIFDKISKGNCLLVQYDRFYDEQSIKPFGVDSKAKNGAKRAIMIPTPTMFILPVHNQIPYLIFPGDTLEIYTSKSDAIYQPSLKHKNSNLRTAELTFFEYITKRLGPCYGAKSYSLSNTIDSYPKAVEYSQKNKESRIHILDSMYKNKIVGSHFFKIASEYFQTKQLDDQIGYLLKPKINESLTETKILEISNKLINDLISCQTKDNYPWYNAVKNYVELTTYHLSKQGKTFSEILNWLTNLPDSKEKDFSLFYYFKREIRSHFPEEATDLLTLKKHCMDSSFISYIESNVNVTNRLNIDKNADLVLNQSDVPSNIDDILKIHRGKIIVLDFWASWCQPCLEEVPHSKLLASRYKDSNVIFIMLSTDTYKIRWKNAILKYELNSIGENYIIQDFEQNSFIKKYQITNIPRYLVISPSGKIKSSDAPRPSDLTFKEIISNLINKKSNN